MSKCIVPNCNSGYLTCKERYNMFSVPKDPELIKKWQLAIPRKDFIVKAGQGVCHKHFSPDEIVRQRVVKAPDGSIMASEDLLKPYLKRGSIPSIFPNCPSYLSKIRKKRKSPKKREAPPIIKKAKKMKILKIDENSATNNQELSKSSGQSDLENREEPLFVECYCLEDMKNENSKDIQNEIQRPGEKERADLFYSIFDKKDSLLIPLSWNRRQTNDGDFAAIELSKVIARRLEDKLLFVSTKSIFIYDDLHVKATVSDIDLDLDVIGFKNQYVSSTEEIEDIIRSLDEAKVCRGCASPKFKMNYSSYALRDSEGRLRHKNCSIVVSSSKDSPTDRCKNCTIAKKILTNNTAFTFKKEEP